MTSEYKLYSFQVQNTHVNVFSGLISTSNELFNLYCLKFNKSYPTMRRVIAQGERRCKSYSFSTSSLDGVRGQRHVPAALYLWVTDPLDGGLVGLQSQSGCWTLCPCRGSNPDRPARGQLLYWLSYPAFNLQCLFSYLSILWS